MTGGTGYLGRALLPVLVDRSHHVRALVRPGSEAKMSAGVEIRTGDPLAATDIQGALADIDTVVHLVGVPKPSPAKARQFREVDLNSIKATVAAIAQAGARVHLVYLSVAQPAPVMKAYVAVRQEGEALIRAQGIRATFARPWYVLGPGHRWPCLLLPAYGLLRLLPATRAAAVRLGFVTLSQMVTALVSAVENPPETTTVVDVPAIRAARLDA